MKVSNRVEAGMEVFSRQETCRFSQSCPHTGKKIPDLNFSQLTINPVRPNETITGLPPNLLHLAMTANDQCHPGPVLICTTHHYVKEINRNQQNLALQSSLSAISIATHNIIRAVPFSEHVLAASCYHQIKSKSRISKVA